MNNELITNPLDSSETDYELMVGWGWAGMEDNNSPRCVEYRVN